MGAGFGVVERAGLCVTYEEESVKCVVMVGGNESNGERGDVPCSIRILSLRCEEDNVVEEGVDVPLLAVFGVLDIVKKRVEVREKK